MRTSCVHLYRFSSTQLPLRLQEQSLPPSSFSAYSNRRPGALPIYLSVCLSIYLSAHTRTYTYIYTHKYIYTHMCTYTHTLIKNLHFKEWQTHSCSKINYIILYMINVYQKVHVENCKHDLEKIKFLKILFYFILSSRIHVQDVQVCYIGKCVPWWFAVPINP